MMYPWPMGQLYLMGGQRRLISFGAFILLSCCERCDYIGATDCGSEYRRTCRQSRIRRRTSLATTTNIASYDRPCKEGFTALLDWLRSYEDVRMHDDEVHSLRNNKPAEIGNLYSCKKLQHVISPLDSTICCSGIETWILQSSVAQRHLPTTCIS